MKRNKWIKSLAMGLISLGVAVAVGCGQGADKAAEKPQTLDDKVDAIVANMSYKEKLGQMVMIGIHGTELSDDAAYMLSQYHIGNVILFDRNLQSREQTAKLTADLQRSAKENAHQPVPLFIAIDEEGGGLSGAETSSSRHRPSRSWGMLARRQPLRPGREKRERRLKI